MVKQEKAGQVTEHMGVKPAEVNGERGKVVQTITTQRPNFPQHLIETADGLRAVEDGSKIPH